MLTVTLSVNGSQVSAFTLYLSTFALSVNAGSYIQNVFIVIAVCALRVTTEYRNHYLDDFSHLRSHNLFEIGCHGCRLLRVVTLVARLLLCVVTLVARLLLCVVAMVTQSGCHGRDFSKLNGFRVVPVDSRVILMGSGVILVYLHGCTSGKEIEEMCHINSDSQTQGKSPHILLHKNYLDSDPYSLFLYRTGIRV